MARITSLFALILLALPACYEDHELVDFGLLCLTSEPVEGMASAGISSDDRLLRYEAGQPLAVKIEIECVSTCDFDLRASCSASVEGDLITIRSHGSWSVKTSPGSCNSACQMLIADCELEALEAGVYTVVHGDTSFELTIPSNAEVACQR